MKCHYEVMEVPRDASIEDIKKQYKKLALKWHPDRNFGQEEIATQTFKEISSSYNVLSDPNERKWYDDHRESILRGADIGADGEELFDEFADRLNIWKYFNTSCFDDFDDEDKGFFTVYRGLFENIKDIEKDYVSGKGKLDHYPTFGSSVSSSKEVYNFYNCWENYVTNIPFGSADKYNIMEAPNRQVKRLMEKENKKLRETARKDHIANIKSLVAFVKKRDSRLTKFEEEKLTKKKEEEQKKLEKKKQQQEKQREKREQWSQEEFDQVRANERKGAFLLADYDSDYEVEEVNKFQSYYPETYEGDEDVEYVIEYVDCEEGEEGEYVEYEVVEEVVEDA